MTAISAQSDVYNRLGTENRYASEEKDQELGQSAFLELMITQLNNQDPLNPAENTEFIAQLAQFSSVEGMERLNGNFDDFTESFLSNQALQASSLVGRSVSVPAETSYLDGSSDISGGINLPVSTDNLTVNIYDSSGSLVEQIPTGPARAGDINFSWDGANFSMAGKPVTWDRQSQGSASSGEYRFEVTANIDGSPQQVGTSLSANVDSVTMAAGGGIILNLAGVGPVSIDQIQQFN